MTLTATSTWSLACPACRTPFSTDAGIDAGIDASAADALVCLSCRSEYARRDGVWRLLAPEREAHFADFLRDYTTIRHAEGRGSNDPAYYHALPHTAAGDPLAWQWSMRARTWDHVVRKVFVPSGPGQRVVDVGAGVGWLSHRLALLGHEPLAIDLSIDERDGLGAARHYASAWPCAQAEFDRLPLADASADVIVFNASLHYSVNYHTTLTEAMRVLRRDGAIVVLDSPVYRHDRSGRQMVAERHADFERRFGLRSESIASVEYLTDAMINDLGDQLGLRWQRTQAWYGWRWATRPLIARLKRRREPSRFVVLVGRRRR
jgi:ubiquinone/menaquinone biosynthesis C-methylase UbiE/uncharacterized protein YbaR (Trm112 family)